MQWWQGLLLLYIGVCIGWGAKSGWDESHHEFSETFVQAFIHGIGFFLVPFALLSTYRKHRRQQRSARA